MPAAKWWEDPGRAKGYPEPPAPPPPENPRYVVDPWKHLRKMLARYVQTQHGGNCRAASKTLGLPYSWVAGASQRGRFLAQANVRYLAHLASFLGLTVGQLLGQEPLPK